MTSFSNSIHLGDKATVLGKFCNSPTTGGHSIGAEIRDPGNRHAITFWGTFDQLQAIVDELGAALDGARAELDEQRALEEAKEEAFNVAVQA